MEVTSILWTLAIGLLVVGIGVLAMYAFRNLKPKNPTQEAVLLALQPIVWKGIAAGLALAEKGLTDLDVMVAGWDRASIANSAYDLIPDSVMVLGRSIPVSLIKTIVPRSVFIDFVKSTYDSFHAWVLANEKFLESQVAVLKPGGITEVKAMLPPGEQG